MCAKHTTTLLCLRHYHFLCAPPRTLTLTPAPFGRSFSTLLPVAFSCAPFSHSLLSFALLSVALFLPFLSVTLLPHSFQSLYLCAPYSRSTSNPFTSFIPAFTPFRLSFAPLSPWSLRAHPIAWGPIAYAPKSNPGQGTGPSSTGPSTNTYTNTHLHDNSVFFQFLNSMIKHIDTPPAENTSPQREDYIFTVFCTIPTLPSRLTVRIRPVPLFYLSFHSIRSFIFQLEDILPPNLLPPPPTFHK